MKEIRLGGGFKEHYSSFEEMAKAYGHKPVIKKTKDANKLASQQEKFCARHKCKACGNPMMFIGNTNVMVCSNEKCKGLKQTRTDKEGNEVVTYTTSYDILDELGAEIGNNIFS